MSLKHTFLSLTLLIGLSFTGKTQSADLQIEFDEFTQTFTVSLIALDNSFSTNVLMGSSQISIVTDSIVTSGSFSNIQTVNPVNGNWTLNSAVSSPAITPAQDYYAFNTIGGGFDPTTFPAGTKVTLFTFQLSEGCSEGLRLFENSSDPSSSDAGMAGGDFQNDLFFIGVANAYNGNVSPNIVNCDTDGDGIKDVDEVATQNDPCLPAQAQDYTGYVSNNAIWMAADCDGDGVDNGTEHTNGSDPYDPCDPDPFAIPGNGCLDFVFMGPLKDGETETHCMDVSWATAPLTATDCNNNATGTLASGSTFSIDASGCLTVTAPADITTSSADSMCVRICDTNGDCRTTVVKIGITSNPPVIEPDSVFVGDSTQVCLDTTWTTGGDVTINDCDGNTTGTTINNGEYTIDENGCVTYRPDTSLTEDISDTLCVVVCDSSICDTTTIVIPVRPVRLFAKVLLQGALFDGQGPSYMADGLMRDDLRVGNHIGLSPYATDKFQNGTPLSTSMHVDALLDRAENSVVDWIFIQFRSASDSTQVVNFESLLLQRDGDIVQTDGISAPVIPHTMINDSFYVSIRHRNHLGVMTKNPVKLEENVTIDFTDINGEYWSQIINVGGEDFNFDSLMMANVGGRYALWAGDVSQDGKVDRRSDFNVMLADVASEQEAGSFLYNYDNALGYFTGDINMDGKVKYQGSTTDSFILTRQLLAFALNQKRIMNFDFMIEMLPSQK